MKGTSAFKLADMPAILAVKTIRAGLTGEAFDEVARDLALTVGGLATKLGISPRTLRHQRNNTKRLSPESTEKLVRVARIVNLGREIFTTNEAVAQWLSQPAPALDGAAPIDLLDTETGAREVETVLNGIAYGNIM